MNAAFVIAILLLGLFCLAYFTKRRFGVLGLALCAGAILSTSWAATLTPILRETGISIISPPLEAVVATTLILLPSVLLLFGGPTYNKPLGRIVGSVAYALLAFVFIAEPVGQGLNFDDIGRFIFRFITDYGHIVIVAGIGLATADILITRSPKKHEH